jgi:hypothetical protein
MDALLKTARPNDVSSTQQMQDVWSSLESSVHTVRTTTDRFVRECRSGGGDGDGERQAQQQLADIDARKAHLADAWQRWQQKGQAANNVMRVVEEVTLAGRLQKLLIWRWNTGFARSPKSSPTLNVRPPRHVVANRQIDYSIASIHMNGRQMRLIASSEQLRQAHDSCSVGFSFKILKFLFYYYFYYLLLYYFLLSTL